MWIRAGPIIFLLLFVFVPSTWGAVAEWNYGITDSDVSMIDLTKTTANIDNTAHEIALKRILPKSASFYNGVLLDYVSLSPDGFKHFSYDGTNMKEISFLSKSGITNPISAAAGKPYPDALVYDQNTKKLTHYSFSLSGMTENPILSVSGLEDIVSIGTRDLDLAYLTKDAIKYHGYTGAGLTEIPTLSVNSGVLSNPIDFALFPGSYNMAVVDKEQVRYFKNGTELPGSAITGLTKPVSVSATNNGIAVVDGTSVKHYTLSGDTFTYSNALSISSGLTNPRCVAIRPGTQDRIIVDGDAIKYYSYDGTALQYNAALSTTVNGLSNMFTYIKKATVISKTPVGINRDISQARVRAYCNVPNGTSITWSLTIDGSSWTPAWRIRGTASGPVVECSSGGLWEDMGDVSLCQPNKDDPRLMFAFDPPDQTLKWKAELEGTLKVTPKIYAIGGVAVKLDINTKPQTPVINPIVPGGGNACFTTATPTISWQFNDPDNGDTQSGYEVVIETKTGMPVRNETINALPMAALTEYTIPSEVLFNSGNYQFTFKVKTRDKGGLWSDNYSFPVDFCVVAFESPRIKEIVHPSVSQPVGIVIPDPNDDPTYIRILRGWLESELPRTKAGGKVKLLLNGIGLNKPQVTLKAPYSTRQSTIAVGSPTAVAVGTENNKFLFEFWTHSNPVICPDGTLIKGDFTGSNHSTSASMQLDEDNPNKYADGLLTVQGTVLKDWMIVLQGRK